MANIFSAPATVSITAEYGMIKASSILSCILLLFLASQCLAQPPDALLERTGRMVELFWGQVPSFACTEAVSQEKIAKGGKIEYQVDSLFDYLAFTKSAEGNLTIEEVRLQRKKGKPDKSNKPALLSTNGFPSLLLIFHPAFFPNYRYRIQPDTTEEKTLQVRFEHIPGTRSTSALMIRDRIYPLDLQGTAWIDRDTGVVQKMSAGLIAPMKDINIESFNIEVAYKLQSFASDSSGGEWLPAKAVIELRTASQHWRNTHFYSQYKRFSVHSEERVSR